MGYHQDDTRNARLQYLYLREILLECLVFFFWAEIKWTNKYTWTNKEWDNKFKMLQRCKIENGHMWVYENLNDYHDVRLGGWVKWLRSTNGTEKLTDSQFNRLVAIEVSNQNGRVQYPMYQVNE